MLINLTRFLRRSCWNLLRKYSIVSNVPLTCGDSASVSFLSKTVAIPVWLVLFMTVACWWCWSHSRRDAIVCFYGSGIILFCLRRCPRHFCDTRDTFWCTFFALVVVIAFLLMKVSWLYLFISWFCSIQRVATISQSTVFHRRRRK